MQVAGRGHGALSFSRVLLGFMSVEMAPDNVQHAAAHGGVILPGIDPFHGGAVKMEFAGFFYLGR